MTSREVASWQCEMHPIREIATSSCHFHWQMTHCRRKRRVITPSLQSQRTLYRSQSSDDLDIIWGGRIVSDKKDDPKWCVHGLERHDKNNRVHNCCTAVYTCKTRALKKALLGTLPLLKANGHSKCAKKNLDRKKMVWNQKTFSDIN